MSTGWAPSPLLLPTPPLPRAISNNNNNTINSPLEDITTTANNTNSAENNSPVPAHGSMHLIAIRTNSIIRRIRRTRFGSSFTRSPEISTSPIRVDDEPGSRVILRAIRATTMGSNNNNNNNRRTLVGHVGAQRVPLTITDNVPLPYPPELPNARAAAIYNRRTNIAFLRSVYNHNADVLFARSETNRFYAYVETIGVLLPMDMLDLSPPVFIIRAEAQISSFLNMVHAELLRSTLADTGTTSKEDICVDYEKLHHTRWRKSFAADMPTCTICQDNFRSNQKIIIVHGKSCGFHEQCIKRWFEEKPSCPNCRQCVPQVKDVQRV